jgi:hypothetical protein
MLSTALALLVVGLPVEQPKSFLQCETMKVTRSGLVSLQPFYVLAVVGAHIRNDRSWYLQHFGIPSYVSGLNDGKQYSYRGWNGAAEGVSLVFPNSVSFDNKDIAVSGSFEFNLSGSSLLADSVVPYMQSAAYALKFYGVPPDNWVKCARFTVGNLIQSAEEDKPGTLQTAVKSSFALLVKRGDGVYLKVQFVGLSHSILNITKRFNSSTSAMETKYVVKPGLTLTKMLSRTYLTDGSVSLAAQGDPLFDSYALDTSYTFDVILKEGIGP